MKLLVITQKIDKEDDIFGFFHHWVEKLAQKLDSINVICLWQGRFSLPFNVKVWSLGKEKGGSRLGRLFRFYKYIWHLRKDYDAIFVHMNPVYVFLAGFLWEHWQKKIFLWHNHQTGTWLTKAAIKRADRVFYTSPFSFGASFQKSSSKAKKMPAGIDTDLFKLKVKSEKLKVKNSILYVGRIAPIKNVDVLIDAAKMLDDEGQDFLLNIVGAANRENETYFRRLKELAKPLEEKGKIKFWGRIANYQTPEIYNQNELFVNLSPAGLFDKTVLEAMACQTLVLASSPAFQDILPDCLVFKQGDVQDLKDKIIRLWQVPQEQKNELAERLREWVIQHHSLVLLIEEIIHQINA